LIWLCAVSFSVRVPASSANLGPGFDCIGLALDLWLRVDVEMDGGDEIRVEGSPDLLGGDNLVVSAMRVARQRLNLELPGCTLAISGDIPVARGLGSSAAAIVAGIQTACLLAGADDVTPRTIVNIAGDLEGHADNASAAMLGGVTIAVPTETGFVVEALVSELPWTPVVFIPPMPGFTQEARAVVPRQTPLVNAVANISRAALLVYALQRQRADLLAEAMRDALHQPFRAKIFSHLTPCIDAALGAGALGACLSGAGPTILALAEPERVDAVGAAMEAAAATAGVPGTARSLPLATRGCHALPYGPHHPNPCPVPTG
jgi:homoserine kinase